MCTLAQFNQHVLECQDDAYTLAWYLLGDEAAAEAVTQAAIQAAFHLLSTTQTSCRVLVLRQVIHRCGGKITAQGESRNDGCYLALQCLKEMERQAVILVDILNIRHAEASIILTCPVKEVSHLLAQARKNIMQATVSSQKELA